jgi:hypothetical protein
MDARDKSLGEAALRFLCRGTQIVGARWYAGNFFIEIEPVRRSPLMQSQGAPPGDLLLTVESRWTVYPRRPDHLPRREEELPALSLEERLIALARLADQDIVDASLGDHNPHLILTFASGSVFFLNGYDEAYECWNLAMVDDLEGFRWSIVAVPGGDIALFIPKDFSRLQEG